jgi:hypothetical protein
VVRLPDRLISARAAAAERESVRKRSLKIRIKECRAAGGQNKGSGSERNRESHSIRLMACRGSCRTS